MVDLLWFMLVYRSVYPHVPIIHNVSMMSCVTCPFFSIDVAIIIFQNVNPNWPTKSIGKDVWCCFLLIFCVGGRRDGCIHPRKLTWNLRIQPCKRKIIFQIIMFRFYVNLWGCNWLTSQGFWYKKPWSTTGILGDRSKASSKNNSLLALQKSWPGHPCFGRNLWKNVYHQPGSAFEIERKQTSLSFLKKTCDTEVLLFQTCPSFIFEKKTCLPFWERKKLHKFSFKGKTCLPNV